jgi:hypothetical protein
MMPLNETEQAAALQRFGEAVNNAAGAMSRWMENLRPACLHLMDVMVRIRERQRRELLEVLEARIERGENNHA